LSEALQYELAPIGVRVKIVEPGFMNTDFGGRSLDFNNDTALAEYQPLIKSVSDVLGPLSTQGSAPETVAEVVYSAATDESNQLRFAAGADAAHMIETRRASDDASLFAGVKAQFGLA
jgi:NAD(P)-dependent dehydrogenase (short-subunit alcohol dehydrogenase family)